MTHAARIVLAEYARRKRSGGWTARRRRSACTMAAMRIRPELDGDQAAVRRVHDLAFGQEGEGQLVEALREGGWSRLSLVAEEGGRVVGHVLYSDLAIRTAQGAVGALALAPLAVRPEAQGHGIGSALVRESLRRLRAGGHRIALVVGDPRYYGRFGFSAELALPLACEYAGPHFMALELKPGALRGVRGDVRYAPPFQAL
jgi:putative acetyltransferase